MDDVPGAAEEVVAAAQVDAPSPAGPSDALATLHNVGDAEAEALLSALSTLPAHSLGQTSDTPPLLSPAFSSAEDDEAAGPIPVLGGGGVLNTTAMLSISSSSSSARGGSALGPPLLLTFAALEVAPLLAPEASSFGASSRSSIAAADSASDAVMQDGGDDGTEREEGRSLTPSCDDYNGDNNSDAAPGWSKAATPSAAAPAGRTSQRAKRARLAANASSSRVAQERADGPAVATSRLGGSYAARILGWAEPSTAAAAAAPLGAETNPRSSSCAAALGPAAPRSAEDGLRLLLYEAEFRRACGYRKVAQEAGLKPEALFEWGSGDKSKEATSKFVKSLIVWLVGKGGTPKASIRECFSYAPFSRRKPGAQRAPVPAVLAKPANASSSSREDGTGSTEAGDEPDDDAASSSDVSSIYSVSTWEALSVVQSDSDSDVGFVSDDEDDVVVLDEAQRKSTRVCIGSVRMYLKLQGRDRAMPPNTFLTEAKVRGALGQMDVFQVRRLYAALHFDITAYHTLRGLSRQLFASLDRSGGYVLRDKFTSVGLLSSTRLLQKSSLTPGQSHPKLLQRIRAITALAPGDLFVDIGHGEGFACFGQAIAAGCSAYGVELVSARARESGRMLLAVREKVTRHKRLAPACGYEFVSAAAQQAPAAGAAASSGGSSSLAAVAPGGAARSSSSGGAAAEEGELGRSLTAAASAGGRGLAGSSSPPLLVEGSAAGGGSGTEGAPFSSSSSSAFARPASNSAAPSAAPERGGGNANFSALQPLEGYFPPSAWPKFVASLRPIGTAAAALEATITAGGPSLWATSDLVGYAPFFGSTPSDPAPTATAAADAAPSAAASEQPGALRSSPAGEGVPNSPRDDCSSGGASRQRSPMQHFPAPARGPAKFCCIACCCATLRFLACPCTDLTCGGRCNRRVTQGRPGSSEGAPSSSSSSSYAAATPSAPDKPALYCRIPGRPECYHHERHADYAREFVLAACTAAAAYGLGPHVHPAEQPYSCTTCSGADAHTPAGAMRSPVPLHERVWFDEGDALHKFLHDERGLHAIKNARVVYTNNYSNKWEEDGFQPQVFRLLSRVMSPGAILVSVTRFSKGTRSGNNAMSDVVARASGRKTTGELYSKANLFFEVSGGWVDEHDGLEAMQRDPAMISSMALDRKCEDVWIRGRDSPQGAAVRYLLSRRGEAKDYETGEPSL